MLPQLPEDHKLKSDLHSTLPLCASICGVIGPESLLDCGTVVGGGHVVGVEVVVELHVLNAPKKVTLLGAQVG